MHFKATAALFCVLILVAAFVYYSEFHHKEQLQKEEESKDNAIPLDGKSITEISLIYPSRTITGVKKGEKQWEITTLPGVDADSDAWEQLASGISGLKRAGIVEQNAKDLSPYGLLQPPVRVTAKLKDGKSVGFRFGIENPKKTANYAKLEDSNDVFLTLPPWEQAFTKTVSDMRDKSLLKFEADDVDGVQIADRVKEIELKKTGDRWQLKSPVDTNAENAEVTSLIRSIRLGRAASFPESSVDAKAAGLDPAAIRITLHDGKAKADRVLLIGRAAEADMFYARDASRDVIFIINKEIPLKAALPVINWRDRSVAQADWQKTDKIEIQRGPENLVLLKNGSDWKLPDGKKLQSDKVSQLLNALENEKARDIIDIPKSLASYGLDKPRLEIVFREGTKELARLAFGAESKSPEGVYAKRSEAAPVIILSRDAFDRLNVKPAEFADGSGPPLSLTPLSSPPFTPPPVVPQGK